MPSHPNNPHPYPNSPYLYSPHRQPPNSSYYQYSANVLGEQEWEQLWHARVKEEQNRRMKEQGQMGDGGRGTQGQYLEPGRGAEEERERWREAQTQPRSYERARSRARSRSRGPHDRRPQPSPSPNGTTTEGNSHIQQSLRAIEDISSQFSDFRRKFAFPSTISFQVPSSPSGIITISTISPSDRKYSDSNSDSNIPKLAYDSNNRNLHEYLEKLEDLIVKFDGVKSWDDLHVRGRRKAGVKQIQEERDHVEEIWKDSWLKHVKEQGASSSNRMGFWN